MCDFIAGGHIKNCTPGEKVCHPIRCFCYKNADQGAQSGAHILGAGINAFRGGRANKAVAKDVLEAAPTATSPFSAPPSRPTQAATGLPPADLETAQQAIALASDGHDAQPVVDWLRAHPDPAAQDQFLDLMFKFGAVAGEILDSAQRLPEAGQAILARALDRAYRSGAVTADELKAAVERFGYGAAPGEDHVGLAEIIGQYDGMVIRSGVKVTESGEESMIRSG